MQHNAVLSSEAPAAIGPYSQAICAGNLVYCSGQLGIHPGTGELVQGGIANETHQALKNLSAILNAAGLSMRNVVKTTVFLADLADFKAMNEVYASFFTSTPPARSTVQVAALPRGGRVEIEAVANRGA